MSYEINDLGKLLSGNAYGGRGIILGTSPNGRYATCAYFIMGRSENSRNRVFIEEDGGLVIHPFDESKVEDPSLIIYWPIRALKNKLIVTNGDQTDTVRDYLVKGKSFEEALETREFEPDAPNFTPRISGLMEFAAGSFSYKLSILKSGDPQGRVCNRFFYSYKPVAGLGHYIHTYMKDGNPLPTFQGEPERVSQMDDIKEYGDLIWRNLNEDNKIALYVRYVDLKTGREENLMFNKNVK